MTSAMRCGSVLRPREKEVLRLMAHGLSTQEVANELGMSASKIQAQKERAMEKMGFKSRIDLIRHAAHAGWLNGG